MDKPFIHIHIICLEHIRDTTHLRRSRNWGIVYGKSRRC